ICKLAGATVFATSSADWKLEKARELGADATINYNETDFVDEIMRRTQKRGVDVVIEHVGGDFLNKSIRCLTRGGTLVTTGGTKSYECVIEVNYVFHKELTIVGSNSFHQTRRAGGAGDARAGPPAHRDRPRLSPVGGGGSASLSRIRQSLRQGRSAGRALSA